MTPWSSGLPFCTTRDTNHLCGRKRERPVGTLLFYQSKDTVDQTCLQRGRLVTWADLFLKISQTVMDRQAHEISNHALE